MRLFIGLLVLFFTSAIAKEDRGIQCFLGPEVYYVKREREGSGQQTGGLYGIRGGYEKIKRYKFYYALEGLYSCGTLKGHSHDHSIKSELTNTTIDARFGYTFAAKCWPWLSFTPFLGVGYCWEYNRYLDPSPIKVHFDNRFPYLPFGFLTSCFLSPQLQIRLNFTARFLWDGKQKVTHDPEYSHLIQCYEEHLQYRVELPVQYFFQFDRQGWAIRFTAFYEYRHYGHVINFPFDFIDTSLNFYGANLECVYCF